MSNAEPTGDMDTWTEAGEALPVIDSQLFSPGEEPGEADVLANAVCPIYEPPVALGNLADPAIVEASGLTESWRNPGVLWTHNDSGNRGQLFAINRTGAQLGVFELDGAQPRDWEDVAVGPGPQAGLSYVYQADVGDNASARANVVIRRFPEPQVVAGAAPFSVRVGGLESFTLVYPDGPHNCESLLVDPQNGDVYLVAKSADGISPVFRAAAPLVAGNNRMAQVALLRFGQAPLAGNASTTGSSFSRAGDAILIRTYTAAFLWRRAPGVSVAAALGAAPCPMPPVGDAAEAIAFAVDGSGYYSVAEGARRPVYFYRHRPVIVAVPPLIDGRNGLTPIRYRVPLNNNLGINWTTLVFDDRAWTAGLQGLGYEDDAAEYEPLLSDAVDPRDANPNATSVQVRLRFAVANPAAVAGLTLRMKYDDGYVAWLNGVEVARRNVPAGQPTWNGRATNRSDAQAIVYQDVDIQAFANRLVPGVNVLAVHVMNTTANSSDMLMNVELIHR